MDVQGKTRIEVLPRAGAQSSSAEGIDETAKKGVAALSEDYSSDQRATVPLEYDAAITYLKTPEGPIQVQNPVRDYKTAVALAKSVADNVLRSESELFATHAIETSRVTTLLMS
jgi:hypothetical protein